METCKEFLKKFETIKSGFFKVRSASPTDKDMIVIFARVRFIFTRFSRLIAIQEVIMAKHKTKVF